MERLTGKTLKCFYALEGIDGAGKTTVVRELKKLCVKHGMDEVLLFHAEPTSELSGLACRNLLSSGLDYPPSFSAYMFAADRYSHLYGNDNGVLALIERGKMVLTDRYLYSSMVYQASMHDDREEYVQRRELADMLNKNFEKPEKIFFLKCTPELARERQKERGQRPFDSMDRLAELGRRYETLFERLEARHKWALQDGTDAPAVVRLDASKDAKELAETMYKEIFA